MLKTLFSVYHVKMAPADPILGLTEAFNADVDHPNKVNLGVGVYQNSKGKVPLMSAVQEAEAAYVSKTLSRGYQPIDGSAIYNKLVSRLVFGETPENLDRVATFQTLGGTGALRVGATLLRQVSATSNVFISNPSWDNHFSIFENAWFVTLKYPYYDEDTHGVCFDKMISFLIRCAPKSIIVLHACCHNPTGADLTKEQWQQVVNVVRENDLIPFIDMAYQGFGEGLEQDAFVPQLFLESGVPFLLATSFSKSFSLYGERVGALCVVTNRSDETKCVISQVKRIIRAMYSSPPTHGAALVSSILAAPDLRTMWENELTEMRLRIIHMRQRLFENLVATGVERDFSFLLKQYGMFSFTGLSAQQVTRLQTEFGIYAVSNGRICVAALNDNNVEYVASAIANVL